MVKPFQKFWLPWYTNSQVKKNTDILLIYWPLDQVVNLEGWLNISRKYTPQYTDLCNVVIYLFKTIQHFIISTEWLDWTSDFWQFKEHMGIFKCCEVGESCCMQNTHGIVFIQIPGIVSSGFHEECSEIHIFHCLLISWLCKCAYSLYDLSLLKTFAVQERS